MQSNKIINTLKSSGFKEWLIMNRTTVPSELALQLNSVAVEERTTRLKILHLYQKSFQKLPFFTSNFAAMSDKSFEQCSSEKAAMFKASLFSGESMLNITGGLGVDDWAFSKKFRSVVSLDCDKEIHELACYNLIQVGVDNVERQFCRAEDYFDRSKIFDLIYADPDRRAGANKNFLPEFSEPNVVLMEDKMLSLASKVLIKFSPLVDLTYLYNVFKYITKSWVVSVDNEVKEILILLEKSVSETKDVNAVILTDQAVFSYSKNVNIENKSNSKQNLRFFEPALALIKADMGNEWFQAIGLAKVGKNTAFYYGNIDWPEFPGRAFEIIREALYKTRLLKSYLVALGINKAHVKKRDFPLTVSEIRNTLKLKEGGEDYFFFFRKDNGTLVFVHCKKAEIRRSLF